MPDAPDAPSTTATTFPVIALSDPAEVDIVGYRGDSGSFRVTVTQGGAPLDVSAAVWDADIRLAPDAPVLATMTVTPVVGTTNAVDVVLPAEQSAQITDTATVGTPTTEPGPPTTVVEAVWDLEMTLGTDPNTTTTTLLRGKVTMTKDVSRPLPPTDVPPDETAAVLGGPEPATGRVVVPTGPMPTVNGEPLTRIGGPDRPAPGAPAPGPTTMPT
jgi:hypothetical protein